MDRRDPRSGEPDMTASHGVCLLLGMALAIGLGMLDRKGCDRRLTALQVERCAKADRLVIP